MSESASLVVLGDETDHNPPPRGLVSLNESRRPHLSIPGPEDVARMQAYGEMIAASKLFPKVTTWQAAIVIIQYGEQLGIGTFPALKDIDWIDGKPACNAGLMNSLIVRDHGGEALIPLEFSPTRVAIRYKRREWTEAREQALDLSDIPDLLKRKDNWRNYPGDMLWARLVSRIGRQSFADTIKGLYTRDEIEDARAIETTARVVESKPVPRERRHEEDLRDRAPLSVSHQTGTPAPTVPDRPNVPDVPDKPNAPDPGPSRAPRQSPNTPEAIRETWFTNIQRARTIHRLDEIAATLVNVGLGDDDGLMQALSDRSVTLHAEEDIRIGAEG